MLRILISFFLIFSSVASEPIGFYSKGNIKDSASVDNYNGHFEKLFRSRNQLHSTETLLTFVRDISNEIKTKYQDVEKLQIGDISSVNGGKINRHQSHQNGLDIDVVYLRVNRRGQSLSNPEWAEDFSKGKIVSSNFDVKRNWELFKIMVSKGSVGRIFVDWSVKNKYCSLFSDSIEPSDKEVLRRLRPAKYHKTHFHLRLECPKNASRCRKQSPPTNNSGCSNLTNESL